MLALSKPMFSRVERVYVNLLHFLDGYTIPDDIVDGFFETLAPSGFCETQVHAVMDIGLVEYSTKAYVPDEQEQSYLERFPDVSSQNSLGGVHLPH